MKCVFKMLNKLILRYTKVFSCSRRNIMEFPPNYYSLYDELLFKDISKESFHTCFSDLYTEVKYNTDVKMINQFPKRLVGKFPVKIGNKKRLWTPVAGFTVRCPALTQKPPDISKRDLSTK